jgi:hypothetical protein
MRPQVIVRLHRQLLNILLVDVYSRYNSPGTTGSKLRASGLVCERWGESRFDIRSVLRRRREPPLP